jgi:hypothetical protein
MGIPSMRRDIARMLFNNGFGNPEDVGALTVQELVGMIGAEESGMTEDETVEIAKGIIGEAEALTEQMGLLDKFEEESTWKKVMKLEDGYEMGNE